MHAGNWVGFAAQQGSSGAGTGLSDSGWRCLWAGGAVCAVLWCADIDGGAYGRIVIGQVCA